MKMECRKIAIILAHLLPQRSASLDQIPHAYTLNIIMVHIGHLWHLWTLVFAFTTSGSSSKKYNF